MAQTVSVLLNTTPSVTGDADQPGASLPQQTFPAGGDDNRVLVTDLNGDSRPDLVTSNPSNDNVAVLAGNGDGTFQPPQTFAASGFNSLSIADINGDGRPDLVGNYFGRSIALLFGNGNGTFQDQQTFSVNTTAVALITTADINGDGRPDLVVADGDNYTVGVILTTLNGADFTSIPTVLKHDAILNVTGSEVLFDGYSHAVALTATGINGEDLSAIGTLSATRILPTTPPVPRRPSSPAPMKCSPASPATASTTPSRHSIPARPSSSINSRLCNRFHRAIFPPPHWSPGKRSRRSV